jgi:hypothetical protein
MKIITFGVLSDQPCEPLQELKALIRANPTKLPRTVMLWNEAPGGCHRLAAALMQDLVDAGDARHCPWEWCVAYCNRNALGWHSFNRSSGWCFDFSNQRPVLVLPCEVFLRMRGAEQVRVAAAI